MLIVYTEFHDEDEFDRELKSVRKISKDAIKLGHELDRVLLSGNTRLPWRHLISNTETLFLSSALSDYGGKLERIFQHIFKSKSVSKLLRDEFLLWASEIVRLETGHFHDAHLSELLQMLFPVDHAAALDGEAIRKRRDRFVADFPKQAEAIRERARSPDARAADPTAGGPRSM